jgi:ankyrin repeat protein
MQKQPKMSLVKHFCRRDPKAFALCDETGRSVLHLVAQYSESLELLQDVLQMDSKMTKKFIDRKFSTDKTIPLGMLCRRPSFSTYDKMLLCLVGVDSSVEVISNGIICCLQMHDRNHRQSREDSSVILLTNLLHANPNVIEYNNGNVFCVACSKLRGMFGITVLSLFLINNSDVLKSIDFQERLPIHHAASHSCLEVLKFLHKAYPESITAVDCKEKSLLHLATADQFSDDDDVKNKVQYLCDQVPAMIHLKDHKGYTALQKMLKMTLWDDVTFNFEIAQFLLNLDLNAVKEACAPDDDTQNNCGQLPLHFICQKQ